MCEISREGHLCYRVFKWHDLVSLILSCITNHIVQRYYRVRHASKSQDDKSWGIGHVLFAITKSCRIIQSACRSLRLMAFQLKQEQDKIDNPIHASILS